MTIKGEGNLDNLTNAKATVYNEVDATCVLDSGNYAGTITKTFIIRPT